MSKRNPCPQAMPMGRDALQIADLRSAPFVILFGVSGLPHFFPPHKHLLTCKDACVICKDLLGLWLDTLYFRGDKE